MSELKLPRLLAAAKEFNIGQDTLIDFLLEKGFLRDDLKPTSKLTEEMYEALKANYLSDKHAKINRDQIELPKGSVIETRKKEEGHDKGSLKSEENVPEIEGPKVVKHIDLSAIDSSIEPKKGDKKRTEALVEERQDGEELQKEIPSIHFESIDVEKITGPKILGPINLHVDSDSRPIKDEKRKRKRFAIEHKVKVRSKLPKLTWQEVKNKYRVGDESEFILKSKVQPGVLNFAITESFTGILHISDLNWNLGLSQLDYRKAIVGMKMTVQIIGFDDRYRKVILGRKYLKSIQKPSNSPEWKSLELNKEITVTVFEELKKKLVVRTDSGLFGTIPRLNDNHYEIGSRIYVIPIRKLSNQNLLEFIQKELTDLASKQTESVVKSFKESAPDNGFITSEKHLTSIDNLKGSLYWNYFENDEKEVLRVLFSETPGLFSKVDKNDAAICFEFDFANNTYEDFKFKTAPSVFGLDRVDIPDDELLKLLSEMSFWYTQFETSRKALGTNQNLEEKLFTLFNEKISIRGFITDDGAMKIKYTKSKISDGVLRDMQMALKKNDVVFLNRPVLFSKYGNLNAENKKFIKSIDNKILAFKLFEVAKTKSLTILQEQGKDFKIFHNYLDSQIEYESKENDKKEFAIMGCRLEPGIHIGGLTIKAEAISKPNIVVGDKVTVSVNDNKGKLKSIGVGHLLGVVGNTVTLKSTIENLELLQEGAVLKKIISTRQHDVQIDTLNKFFSNKLPLDTLYTVFHNKELIDPPEKPELKFFNEKLGEKEGPQSLAVKKAVGNKNILLIQGPPGTGKTTVITEIVKQLISCGKKVLVCSQTHVAVDNVLERICEDSSVEIARVGNLESISETASHYLIEEGRKQFAIKLQKNVDTKIDLINLYLSGADLAIYNKEQIHDVNVFDWSTFDQFIEQVQSCSSEENLKTIKYLEHWKEVIVKSPVLLTDIFLKNLDVVFGTCIGIATNREFSESDVYFDTVILDEAGKANISETLTAISRAKRIILVGDHKQLPPYLDRDRINYFQQFYKEVEDQKPTEDEIKKALGASFFEYLQKDGVLPQENKILLDEQFRMHPDIANFISWAFYDSSLRNGDNTINNILPLPEPFDRQLIFVDTSTDRRSFETSSDDSYYNQVEAEFIVRKIIPQLDKNNIAPNSYAILSPYSRQCEKICELLEDTNHESRNRMEIATLDSFQGREYDLIIFSFTRSSSEKRVGFLDDARRLNVALSRAKKKLILIGNAQTLQSPISHFDKYYCHLFRNLWKYAGKYGYAFAPNDLDFRRLQTSFTVGEIKKGKVKRVFPGGILVNMGAKDGFIPKSFFKKSITGVFQERQEVSVEILWISNDGKITLKPSNDNDLLFPKGKVQYLCFKSHFSIGDIVSGKVLNFEPAFRGMQRMIVELPCQATGTCFFLNKNNSLKIGEEVRFKISGCFDDRLLIDGEIVL